MLIGGEWVGSGGTITQALIDYAHSKNVLFNGWTINMKPDVNFNCTWY